MAAVFLPQPEFHKKRILRTSSRVVRCGRCCCGSACAASFRGSRAGSPHGKPTGMPSVRRCVNCNRGSRSGSRRYSLVVVPVTVAAAARIAHGLLLAVLVTLLDDLAVAIAVLVVVTVVVTVFPADCTRRYRDGHWALASVPVIRMSPKAIESAIAAPFNVFCKFFIMLIFFTPRRCIGQCPCHKRILGAKWNNRG